MKRDDCQTCEMRRQLELELRGCRRIIAEMGDELRKAQDAQIQAEVLAQLLGAAIIRLKELGETSWELPPYARSLAAAIKP